MTSGTELLIISTNLECPETLTDGAGVVWQRIEVSKRGAVYKLAPAQSVTPLTFTGFAPPPDQSST